MSKNPPVWTTACPDWAARIVAQQSLIPFDPLFPDEAQAAWTVFERLFLKECGLTLGQASRPWMRGFIEAIFGCYDAEQGRRLITEFMLLISKKNNKSSGAAGIMMTAMIRNWREAGEYLILAPTKEIAKNSYEPARDMVKSDPQLDAIFLVQDHQKTITHKVTGATLKVVAADSDTVGGKKAIGVLVDELWLFGKQPNAANMLLEATGGKMSRPEGFTIYLSTQSDQPPAGVFKTKLDYARGVRDGLIQDPRFLPVLYEFPEAMLKAEAYTDTKNFFITNPNLGASVDEATILEKHARAAIEGKAELASFYAKHLNVQIGNSLREDRWPGADLWQGAAGKRRTLEDIIEECEVIEAGVDGGGLDDLLGLTISGRTPAGKWLTWSRAWVHPIALERRKAEAARYQDFIKQGDLVLVERAGQDVAQMAALISQVFKADLLDKVGVDQRGLGGILEALEAEGIPEDKIVGIPQGWKISASIITCERKLNEGVLEHSNQDLMAWCVGNARVAPAGNATYINKQVSGSGKIDPLMALFNTMELLGRNPPAAQKKYQMLVIG